MKKYCIKNPNFLNVIDESVENGLSYGLTQEWYKDDYQVLAGCGATVASSILIYYEQQQSFKHLKIEDVLPKMEELWQYLPPIKGKGLNSTKLFYSGIEKYSKDKNLNISYNFVDVNIKNKISLKEIVNFLIEELENDRPVAFLNLCNGEEKNLDKWHWVIIYELLEDNNEYFVNIFDDRESKKINLSLWYNTISDDGGFVSFHF